MKDLWHFMKLSLNPDDLTTMREVLDRLQDNTAIDQLRDEQMKRYHNTLLWRYPLSHETAAGGFILPVREGILWIPYGETGTYEGDLLITDDVHILSEKECETMLREFSSYVSQLCDVLQQSATISHRLEHGEEGNMIDLGSFEVVSGKLAISDPCYEVDVWCRGELENCKLGTWNASAIEKHMGSWGHRICKLIAVHEDYIHASGMRDRIEQEAKKLDPKLYERYKNIKQHCTPPMAKLINDQCSGCFMSLPSATLLEIRTGDRIVECDNCRRILYDAGE